MEVFIYGKGRNGRNVEQHVAIGRPKIWTDAQGFTILKANNVEINLSTQDINRLSRASERAGAALEA